MYSRIKEVRKALGLSQSTFGEKLGLTQQAIASIESGKTPISDKHIKPICSIFNVSENWIKFGKGEMFEDDDIDVRFNHLYKTLNNPNKELVNNILDMMLSQQDEENINHFE